MKKYLGLYDKEEEESIKCKLISYSGVQEKYVNFIEMYIEGNEYIHVTLIDDTRYKNKKDLVFIHGFAGSALHFFKMFKTFSETYRIIGIDLPGMGCSSRHDFSHDNFEQTEDYFVNKLKICFDKMNLNKINIIAHSFGAYLSCLFTMRYPYMIEHLILISPVGLSSNFADTTSTVWEAVVQNFCFKVEKSPTFIFKTFMGFITNYIVDAASKQKFKGLTNKVIIFFIKEELKTNCDFTHLLMRNQVSSEQAVFTFFDRNLQPYKPVTLFYELLKEIPILILYGENDWSPKSQAEDLKKLLPDTVKIEVVSESGHLINFDNHIELNTKILDFLEKKDKVLDSNSDDFSNITTNSMTSTSDSIYFKSI